MQSLKEVSAEALLKAMPEDVHEIIVRTYLNRFYFPRLDKIENIFDNIVLSDEFNYFDTLCEFCDCFPECVIESDQTILHRARLNFEEHYILFRRDERTFCCRIPQGIDSVRNNAMIEFFEQRGIPTIVGISVERIC